MNRNAVKVYLPFLLIVLLTGYGTYFLASTHWASHPPGLDVPSSGSKKPEAPETPSLLDKKAGWWESNALIYHGIPARILFFLPKANRQTAEAVNAAAWKEFERIGSIFNPFDPASEVARINSAAQTRTPPIRLTVSKDIYEVMKISQDLWTASNENFDPTLWPLKQLWKIAEKQQQVPSVEDVQKVMQSIGFGAVRLADENQGMVQVANHPVLFDFGGVVKGYAVDQVRRMLSDAGAAAGLIQLGGEIVTFGPNQDGLWRIGIQHPRNMDKVWGVIESEGGLRVSTSGNYRQPIRIGNRSFYHIFSPKTGWPVSEKVLGVTTVCLDETASSARLDGMATAITVMGPSAGLELAEKTGMETVILYEAADGNIGEMITNGLAHCYKKD